MKPKDLVYTAISKGYDVIGAVDHNNISGGKEAENIAGENLLVIGGEEIKTDLGEIVVLLSDGKYNRDLLDICERANDENHFIFVPHPFDYVRTRISLGNNIERIKSLIDAVEVFNSRVLVERFNEKAETYAENNKIPKIAGSDAHFVQEIGNVTCFLDCERNVDSVFSFIRKNKMQFEGKRTLPLYNIKSSIIKAMKH